MQLYHLPTMYVLSKKSEKDNTFLCENCHFLQSKNCSIIHRCVNVMALVVLRDFSFFESQEIPLFVLILRNLAQSIILNTTESN